MSIFYVPQFLHNDAVLSSLLQIADAIAYNFAEISSDKNYDRSFLDEKITAESLPVIFYPDFSNNPYNKKSHPVN